MEGTVVEFTKEHGVGRVAVDGAGELPFDAGVVRLALAELVPGKRVQVEVGPSRLGGSRVVKLWVPGREPKDPSASIGPSREVKVGPYSLLLPDFWRSGDVVEKPELVRYGGVAAPGVSFDFALIVGSGGDTTVRAQLVGSYTKGHAGAQYRTWQAQFGGATFEAHSFDGSPALAAGSRYEMYVGDVYGDLMTVGFGLAPSEVARRDSWANLFSTMVQSAIVRRGPPGG